MKGEKTYGDTSLIGRYQLLQRIQREALPTALVPELPSLRGPALVLSEPVPAPDLPHRGRSPRRPPAQGLTRACGPCGVRPRPPCHARHPTQGESGGGGGVGPSSSRADKRQGRSSGVNMHLVASQQGGLCAPSQWTEVGVRSWCT